MLFDIYYYSKTHSMQTDDDGFWSSRSQRQGADPSSDTQNLDLFFSMFIHHSCKIGAQSNHIAIKNRMVII